METFELGGSITVVLPLRTVDGGTVSPPSPRGDKGLNEGKYAFPILSRDGATPNADNAGLIGPTPLHRRGSEEIEEGRERDMLLADRSAEWPPLLDEPDP
jgi:hypothetical protein